MNSETPARAADSSPPPGELGRGRRILLVEDHIDSARAMARLLRARGYGVQTADSVQSALGAAGAEPFDLVISDIGLPDGTGLALMRQLQQIRPIKGIALTGFGTEDDVDETRLAGFTAHVMKPVDFEKLNTLIDKLTRPGL